MINKAGISSEPSYLICIIGVKSEIAHRERLRVASLPIQPQLPCLLSVQPLLTQQLTDKCFSFYPKSRHAHLTEEPEMCPVREPTLKRLCKNVIATRALLYSSFNRHRREKEVTWVSLPPLASNHMTFVGDRLSGREGHIPPSCWKRIWDSSSWYLSSLHLNISNKLSIWYILSIIS